MEEGYTIFDSIDLKDANPKKEQEVVVALNSTLNGMKLRKEEEALKYFRMGCLLLEYADLEHKNKISMREFGKITQVPYRKLSYLKTLAKKYNRNEQKFIEAYEEYGATSFDSFLRNEYPRERKYKTLSNKMTQRLNEMMASLRRGDATPDIYNELKTIRDEVNRFIPIVENIVDKNIIMYGNCCGCDEPAPPEGWEIHRDDEYKYIQYPLCPKCDAPDYKLVSKLYATYAIGMEHANDIIL